MSKRKPKQQPTPSAVATDDEAALPAARRAMTDAVHLLAAPTLGTINTDSGPKAATGDSRYALLRQALEGDQGTDAGSIARSMPPIRTDVAQHLKDVDGETAKWAARWGLTAADTAEHALRGEWVTEARLWALDARQWRPQDTSWLNQAANTITRWAAQADNLLDPPRRLDLAAACPACGARWYWRPDDAGETVRTAALTVATTGCHCQACRTNWGPEQFQFLARVLACPLPAGVLE